MSNPYKKCQNLKLHGHSYIPSSGRAGVELAMNSVHVDEYQHTYIYTCPLLVSKFIYYPAVVLSLHCS